VDVLRIEDEWGTEEVRYAGTDPKDLIDRLRDQLFLPARLLRISFTPKEAESADELLIPEALDCPEAVGVAKGCCLRDSKIR
jgi:hypothetical protein